MRLFVFAMILCSAVLICAAQNSSTNQASIPDASSLMKQIEDHQRKLDQTRENYTYREIVVTRELDKNGGVKKTETEEDEVFFVNSHEIDRKVRKNGKELSPDEQKKELDRVMKEINKAQKTPPGHAVDKNDVI